MPDPELATGVPLFSRARLLVSRRSRPGSILKRTRRVRKILMDAHRKDAEHKNLPEIFREAWPGALRCKPAEDRRHKALTRVQDLRGVEPGGPSSGTRGSSPSASPASARSWSTTWSRGCPEPWAGFKLPRREDVEALRQRALRSAPGGCPGAEASLMRATLHTTRLAFTSALWRGVRELGYAFPRPA